MSDLELIKIVLLGRGGMGIVTACEIIAEAAYLSGNFIDVHAYPSFGAERRGAPVQAYVKLSRREKVYDRAQIENPDILYAATTSKPATISDVAPNVVAPAIVEIANAPYSITGAIPTEKPLAEYAKGIDILINIKLSLVFAPVIGEFGVVTR